MSRLVFCFGLIAVPQLLGQRVLFQCPSSVVTVAEGINNSGTVVGYNSLSQGGTHGFIYSGGACSSFDVPNASNTAAIAINDSGTISGYYTDASGIHGFLRSAAGTITPFDYPTTTSNTVGFDINSAGQVIGVSSSGVFIRSGATYTPVIFSHPYSMYSKLGINDTAGVIVGTAGPGCFIDSGGNSSSFSVPGALSTYCYDVNNAGSIAGTYFTSQAEFAFVRVGSTVTTIQGLTGAAANGLNDLGQVVGSYTASNGATGAFVTSATAIRGDFDGNGVPDVVLQFPDSSAGIWYLNATGRQITISSFAFFAGPSSGYTVTDAADLNGDGVPDIILQFADGSIGVWYMGGTKGGQIQNFAFISGPSQVWRPAALGDLNADGQLDLIIQNNTDGSIGVWYLGGTQGNQIQSFAPINGPLAGWKVVGTADLDNDGHTDIILQYTDGSIGVWYMTGAQGSQIQSFRLIADPSSWSVVGVVDMDHDGHPDLVIRNTDGTLGVWYLGGAQGNQITGFTPITGPGNPTWHELATH